MIPPRKSRRVLPRMSADPDTDEDEWPERPQPTGLVLAQVPGANRQGHGAGQDQEDAPTQESPPDVHGRTVPDGGRH